MTIKQIIESTIQRGGYDLATIIERIDTYHIEGKLTDDEREELYAKAQQHASINMNANDEIQRIWATIRQMENTIETLMESVNAMQEAKHGAHGDDGEDEEPQEQEEQDVTVDDWKKPTGAHDAYFRGMKMRWTDGKVYICTAPKDYAVTYGPDYLGIYWEVIE